MEVLQIAERIEKCIDAISLEGKNSGKLIEAKANTMAEYDKAVGVTIASLKAAGKPTTIVEKLAKGNVSDTLYKKILAEETLKAHYCRMENLRAQLNGLQSMNRHVSQM